MKISEKQIETLVLIKGIEQSVGALDRWNSTSDIIVELLSNKIMDTNEFLESLYGLKQMGLIEGEIDKEEVLENQFVYEYDDIKLSDEGEKVIQQDNFKEKLIKIVKMLCVELKPVAQGVLANILSGVIGK
ncbi:MAG: hypothetical protein IJD58_08345 [Lachnospiraceae bacterium]|nr:hypothetical protein [Lachnospiraceae bacterium]